MADASRARMQQIASECLVKSAHIILTSRIYHSSRTLSIKGPKCWFNLDVEELDIAQRELDYWRRDPSCTMIIEVFVQPWTSRGTVQQVNVQPEDASHGRRLVERWNLSYAASEAQHAQQGRASASRLEPAAVYKRMVIAMRSLFSYVRVLPTYRLYKACAQERGGSMALQYCITRGAPGAGSAGAVPGRMGRFAFAPVETQHGSFRMAVDYTPSSAVTILKESTLHGPTAQIIADYAAGDTRSSIASNLSAFMRAPAGAPQPRHLEPTSPHLEPSGSGAPSAEPALRRRSWSLQGPASAFVPSRAPVSLGMSPPTVVVSASSAATRAASQDVGALRRLSLRSGQTETEESSAGAPMLTHAWSTPPKYPGTPTSPGLPSSSGAVQTWSRAAASQEAHARTQQAGSSRRSLETRSQAKPAVGGSRLQSMAEDAAGSGSRQTSAPVSIPGASDTTARHSRIHSSGDLAAMQQQDTTTQVRTVRWMNGQPRVPASAPATSAASGTGQGPGQPIERLSARTTGFAPASSPRIPTGSPMGSLGQAGPSRSCLKRPDGSGGASEERRLSIGGGSAQSAAQQPPTPPALYAAHPMGSESSGSAASSFPASCSPQLPFAFTPSGLSFSSVHDPAAQAAAVASAAAGSGEAAAQAQALTVFRRPLLGASPRLSSAFELPAVVGALGYSLSPVQGSLESSLLSASTPRHIGPLPVKLPLPFPPPPQSAAVLAPGFAVGSGPPRLTYPGSKPAPDLPELPSHSATEDAETELLPFALDSDAMPASPQPLAPLRARAGSGLPPADLDDAVGAFVRVIQEAPAELRQGGEQERVVGESSKMTLQGGLAQLSALKAQLEAM